MGIVTHLDPAFLDASLRAWCAITSAPRTEALSYLDKLPSGEAEKLERHRIIIDVLRYFSSKGRLVTADGLEYVCKSQGWRVGMAHHIYMMVNAGHLTVEKDGALAIGPVQLPKS